MKKAVDYIEKNGNDFLERLGYKEENGVYRILKENNEKVALFCHAAFSRAWVSVLLHIPLHIMWSGFDYDYTGVTVIEFQNNENGFTEKAEYKNGELIIKNSTIPKWLDELKCYLQNNI